MLSDNKLNEVEERLQNADGTRIYDAVNKSAITTIGDDYFVEHATEDVRLLLTEIAELRSKLDDAEEKNEDLQTQVEGVPFGEIARMYQGHATNRDIATIAIWLTIETQRREAEGEIESCPENPWMFGEVG